MFFFSIYFLHNLLNFKIERIRSNLKNLDSFLGAYPYSTFRQWVSLTSTITDKTISRLSPENLLAKITSQTDFVSKEQELEQQMVTFINIKK